MVAWACPHRVQMRSLVSTASRKFLCPRLLYPRSAAVPLALSACRLCSGHLPPDPSKISGQAASLQTFIMAVDVVYGFVGVAVDDGCPEGWDYVSAPGAFPLASGHYGLVSSLSTGMRLRALASLRRR